MRWLLNFLVKILGGFLASLGFFMTKQEPVSSAQAGESEKPKPEEPVCAPLGV